MYIRLRIAFRHEMSHPMAFKSIMYTINAGKHKRSLLGAVDSKRDDFVRIKKIKNNENNVFDWYAR